MNQKCLESFFLKGNDEIIQFLLENGAKFYFPEKDWIATFVGCVKQNGKPNLK